MTNLISGIALLVVGGYMFVMFGNVILQSIRDKRARDDLLSDPHVRNPTRSHRLAFGALAALLLTFSVMLIVRGLSRFGS
ncbi:hypothetical protein OIU35_20385 [Boseaceae bacterium BT-24-1]|nr:hypothetical protein [Boseaceae bacterium BT-24-1]